MADQSVSDPGSAAPSAFLLDSRKRYMRLYNGSKTARHHKEFLNECKRDGLIPWGLRLYLDINVIGEPPKAQALKNNITALLHNTEKQVLEMLSQYYDSLSAEYDHATAVHYEGMEADCIRHATTEQAGVHQSFVTATEAKANLRAKERETNKLRKLHKLRQEKRESSTIDRTVRPKRSRMRAPAPPPFETGNTSAPPLPQNTGNPGPHNPNPSPRYDNRPPRDRRERRPRVHFAPRVENTHTSPDRPFRDPQTVPTPGTSHATGNGNTYAEALRGNTIRPDHQAIITALRGVIDVLLRN